MQVDTSLREMFSYSYLPVIVFIIILVILILFKPKKKVMVNAQIQNKDQIRIKYLNKIELLEKEVDKISSRKAYQKLSLLIRNFIFEMTGIKVQNYTLEDIKKLNIPILSDLVEEYYDPEFAIETNSDILLSIKRAKEVIKRWN